MRLRMGKGSKVPTAKEYIEKLAASVNLADKLWTHYGWVTSQAYATAYKTNQNVLTGVKVAQEAHRKADEAAMSFLLSVLTVGVAGGVAGAVARSAAKAFYDGSKVAEDVKKDVLKWLLIQQAVGPLNKRLVEALNPAATASDVFVPSDITPEEYTASLFEGISYNIALLTWLLYEAQWEPTLNRVNYEGTKIQLRSGGELTVDGAKRLTEAVLSTSFMKEMPPLEISIPAMTRKASLALWIGWALSRDAKYWKKAWDYPPKVDMLGQRIGSNLAWEQLDWEPVRSALIGLGVPHAVITVDVIQDRKGLIARGLDMYAFMAWAAGPHSTALLFDDSIPRNAKGFEMVTQRKSRRTLTPYGWAGDLN